MKVIKDSLRRKPIVSGGRPFSLRRILLSVWSPAIKGRIAVSIPAVVIGTVIFFRILVIGERSLPMMRWAIVIAAALFGAIGSMKGSEFEAGAQTLTSDEVSSGTVTIDGRIVPDISPLPAYVPTPPTNLNYEQKIALGKQLYFDGRLSKNGAISCAFCHNPGTGFADARQFSIGAFGTGRMAW